MTFTIYVYELRSPNLNEFYIGSTVNVPKRLTVHKCRPQSGKACSSWRVIEAGEAYMRVVGTHTVESRAEQHKIEGQYQRAAGPDLVNVNVAGRTARERYEEVERPARGDDPRAAVARGEYRQLARYERLRGEINRARCVARARRLGRAPSARSIAKYGLVLADWAVIDEMEED